MRRKLSLENGFVHRSGISYIKLFRPNNRNLEIRFSLRRIYPKKIGIHPSVTISSRLKQLQEDIPDIIKKLHSFQALCCSREQHELAQKALISLRNCPPEEIINLAKNLSNDVGYAVD